MIMLFTLFLCFLVTLTECFNNQVDLNANDRLIVKLDPAQVVAAFKSVVSSDYLRNLAQDLASRAAEHFLVQMNNKQRFTTTVTPPIFSLKSQFNGKYKHSAQLESAQVKYPPVQHSAQVQYPELKSDRFPLSRIAADAIKKEVIQEIERTPTKENILPGDINTSLIDVKQAMTLLKDPSPDGDNLDQVSPNLSEDEETRDKKRKTPVIQLLKVNGKYFRRLLGFV